MLQIKERANEQFTVRCNNRTNMQILTSKGYIKEVGQCLFLFNQQTELWEVYDARYAYLVIPNYPRHERIWNLFDTKKALFSDKLKPVTRPPVNKVELAKDEIMSAIENVASQELSYRDFYELVKPYFGLRDFIEVKGRDDKLEEDTHE